MKKLTVSLPGREYEIQIERGLLDKAGAACRAVLPKAVRLAVVTDSNVAPLYADRVLGSLEKAGFEVKLFTVPAGETSKCAARLNELWEGFMSFGLTRTDGVVALGGGVVGDLAGFAAATTLRGVNYVQIPTTLLSQVDSSVGGKVAIDLQAGKNLAGAFWQPRLVLMDPLVLDTLTDRVFSDGMAEVIKYGCILDGAFFALLEENPSRAGVMEYIEQVLLTCCDLKRRVVEADERDTGERMLLNFGHTLGHAYELAYHYETYTHGEGVAAGMVAAAALGEEMGVTPGGTKERIAALLAKFSLPTAIPCSVADYAAAIGLDKKSEGKDISLIVLETMGHAVPCKMPRGELLARVEGLGV
jgi:3-dehydroquinate synthase